MLTYLKEKKEESNEERERRQLKSWIISIELRKRD